MQRYYRAARIGFAVHLSPRPAVKVYGLLRTGTNYMTRLLEINFDVFALQSTERGWKHGPCEYSDSIRFVFLVKNPYSWIRSFWEWEKIHLRTDARSLEAFMTQNITHPELRRRWHADTPIDAWNLSLKSWLTLRDAGNVAFVRYESLLTGFDRQLLEIQDRLSLKARLPSFRNLESRADDWKTPEPRKALKTDYYREEQFIKEFSDAELHIMRDRLDPAVMNEFGYEIY